MKNAIKRDFFSKKPKVAPRKVRLGITSFGALPLDLPQQSRADCEVVELHGADALSEWEDSTFIRDFEDAFNATVPMALDPKPAGQSDATMFFADPGVDPFASVSRHSA